MATTKVETPKVGETVTVKFDDGKARKNGYEAYCFTSKFVGKATVSLRGTHHSAWILEKNEVSSLQHRVILEEYIISVERPEVAKRQLLDQIMCLGKEYSDSSIRAILREAESKIRKL